MRALTQSLSFIEVVRPTLTYCLKTWAWLNSVEDKLRRFSVLNLKIIYGDSALINNYIVITSTRLSHRIRWLGYVVRLEDKEGSQKNGDGGRRGRPRMR